MSRGMQLSRVLHSILDVLMGLTDFSPLSTRKVLQFAPSATRKHGQSLCVAEKRIEKRVPCQITRRGLALVPSIRSLKQKETTENKRVLRQLMHRWNRPIYEKETSYRAMRAVHDEPEAMEVMPPGAKAGGGGMRRGMARGIPQRDWPGRDESVGNILNATKRCVCAFVCICACYFFACDLILCHVYVVHHSHGK